MLPGRRKGSEDVGKGQTMVIVSRGRETSGHQVHQVVSDGRPEGYQQGHGIKDQIFIIRTCLSKITKEVWTVARKTSLSFTISWSLPKFVSIESVMPFNHLILFHPFLLLHSVFPIIRVFSNELALHIRWPKYWSFSFSISASNEYSGWFPLGLTGLISLLSKQLSKSLLQHHS